MQVVRIINTYFETDSGGNALEKFKGGEFYAVTEETSRQVALGNGELVDAPEDVEKAIAAAQKARADADKALAKADSAEENAAAAQAAEVIATEPD